MEIASFPFFDQKAALCFCFEGDKPFSLVKKPSKLVKYRKIFSVSRCYFESDVL